MALTRTWSAQLVNQVPADQTTLALQHKNVIYQLKRFLTGANPVVSGGAWTVERSSDGSTAGASDLWDGASKLIWAQNGTAHSWIVFKSPAGFVKDGNFLYILIDLRQSGGVADAQTHEITFECSGAPYTGGSTTVPPTNANLTVITGNAAPTQWASNVLANCKFHATRNTVGDFIFLLSKDGSNIAETSLGCVSLTNTHATDNFPVAIWKRFNNAVPGAMDQLLWNGDSGAFMSTTWTSGARLANNAGACAARPRNPSGTDLLDQVDGGGDDIDGTYLDWSIEVWNHAGAQISYRGRCVDLAFGPSHVGVTQCDGIPSSGFEKVIVGECLVPFTGSKPSFS